MSRLTTLNQLKADATDNGISPVALFCNYFIVTYGKNVAMHTLCNYYIWSDENSSHFA